MSSISDRHEEAALLTRAFPIYGTEGEGELLSKAPQNSTH